MASTAKIPVIDVSAEGADREQVAKELVEAAATHGFVYLRNLGRDIPIEAIENAFELSKRLFASPTQEKEVAKMGTNNRGWAGMQVEILDPKNQRVGDYKEVFNFGEFADGKARQPLPPAIAKNEAQVSAFFDLCYDLCIKLNELLGIGLQVSPPEFFKSAHLKRMGPSANTLRFLYYPPLTATDAELEDVRAGAHSDYGSLTLLFRLRGQAGLEILTEANEWAPVPVSPPGTEGDPAPPILMNIGDLLSYWTNGLLRSTVHRVIFPSPGRAVVEGETDTEPRYSIAFFCHPVGSSELGAVPSDKVKSFAAPSDAAKGNPYAERKVVTADEHLQMRLRASYLNIYDDKKEES